VKGKAQGPAVFIYRSAH